MAFKTAIQSFLCLALMLSTAQGQIIETEILPEPQGDRVWNLGDAPPPGVDAATGYGSSNRSGSGLIPPPRVPQGSATRDPIVVGTHDEIFPPGIHPRAIPPGPIPPGPIPLGPRPPKISPIRQTPDGSATKNSLPGELPEGIKPIFAPDTSSPLSGSLPPIIQSDAMAPLSDPSTFSLGTVQPVESCACEDELCDCESGDTGISVGPESGISIGRDDAFPTVKVTGFFQLDSAWFSQDADNRLTLGDINDGLGFRRARFAATGDVAQDISYVFEFDIAQSQARFVDVWVQASNTRFGNVRIGRYRQPFGLAEQTSIRDLPFLERPLTFTQSPFRQTGVMLFDTMRDERGTWAASGYRFLSDNFGNVFADNGGYGLATRLTRIVASSGDDRLVHIGADYSYNDPGNGVIQLVSTNEVFVGQNPNLGPAGLSVLPIVGVTPFVNTGEIAANNLQLLNFEAAIALGRTAIQGEARYARVDLPSGPTATFPGAYAQIRYMLTGETIPYNKSNGVFGRIVPDRPWTPSGDGPGAWEILGRVSHLDLNDSGIEGNRLTDFTVGANWYWNRYVKMQFNYIHSRLDNNSFGESNANTFAVRAQLDF